MMTHFIYCIVFLFVLCDGQKPPFWEKTETARWLAHQNLWGTLSTTSVHLNGQAWGQPKSFVDGGSTNSTGVLYFYDSDMDTSMEDIHANPLVAFSLSSAQLFGHCNVNVLDPENPRCARVVFSGKFVDVEDKDEYAFAQASLFERHPEMSKWPDDHSWKIHKINLTEIWLIDIFGGGNTMIFSTIYSSIYNIILCTFILSFHFNMTASIVDIKDYYAVDMSDKKFLSLP